MQNALKAEELFYALSQIFTFGPGYSVAPQRAKGHCLRGTALPYSIGLQFAERRKTFVCQYKGATSL